jgi:hypothetical protein
MPYVEDFGEFVERQGGCEYLEIDNHYVWSNGAIATLDGTFRMHPPVDPDQLRRNKLKYLQEKLRIEIATFHRFKQDELLRIDLSVKNRDLPGPTPNAAEQLRAGSERIKALQQEIAGLINEQSLSQEEQVQIQLAVAEQDRIGKLGAARDEILAVQAPAVAANYEHELRLARRLEAQQRAMQGSLQFFGALMGKR